MNSYDPGSAIVLSSAFTNAAGVATDPTTVTLRILDPAGVEQIIAMGAMTHVSLGVFAYVVTVMKSGVWYYRFEGVGACIAAQENNFAVRSSAFVDAAP